MSVLGSERQQKRLIAGLALVTVLLGYIIFLTWQGNATEERLEATWAELAAQEEELRAIEEAVARLRRIALAAAKMPLATEIERVRGAVRVTGTIGNQWETREFGGVELTVVMLDEKGRVVMNHAVVVPAPEGVPLTKGGARPFSVTVEDPPPGTVDVTVSITDMEEWKVSGQ
jgi:hypothetical protein